jgi:hypothetical protein
LSRKRIARSRNRVIRELPFVAAAPVYRDPDIDEPEKVRE